MSRHRDLPESIARHIIGRLESGPYKADNSNAILSLAPPFFTKACIWDEVILLQLDRMKPVVDQKWPGLANRRDVVFYPDNARHDTSIVTHQKIQELGWEILKNPSYSPRLAASD
ncbi:hypothetical protein TNCV_53921 [Trichonephila clavipes]|nr:hypothetical protein TNCV_53921 [Trichonephila clavipes]